MATFSYADLSDKMSTVYREVVGQVQRQCPTLQVLSGMGRLRPGDTGDQVRWEVRFSGQVADAVNPDGGAFLTPASDPRATASLPFGSYSAPMRVTDKIQWASAPSAGIPNEINPLLSVMNQQFGEAIEAVSKLLNQEIYIGTGSNDRMVGLSTAVAATGTYAGLSQATYSAWASYRSANGGSLRSLTLAMIKTATSTIATNSRLGRPNLAFCNTAMMDSVEALFDAYTRVTYSPGGAVSLPTSTMERMSNPTGIRTAGGTILGNGFRIFKWENQNLYFVEDPDCRNSAEANPTNVVYLMNGDDFLIRYLRPPEPNMFGISSSVVSAAIQDLGPLAELQMQLKPRSRITFADLFDVLVMLTPGLRSRNAHGLLADVQ